MAFLGLEAQGDWLMQETTTTVPKTTIGLDLGDRITHACVLDADARVVERFRFETTQAGLAGAFARRPVCRVVLEVGTHSPWISRALEHRGHQVFVANPKQVRSISGSSHKNDEADSEQLARLGRSDPQLLRPIRHRGESAQRDRGLLAVRRQLVAMRTSLACQVHGLAKALGDPLPRCAPEALVRKVRPHQDRFPGLDQLLDVVEVLDERIKRLDQEVERMCREAYPESELVRQVPGVGPITALTFVLTLEDPARFEQSRRVGSYLGLQPKQRDSGKRKSQLPISKEGDRELRSLLVQCAHWILTRGPDSDLKRAGLRRMERGGAAARKKSVVAVARKLGVVLHHLWQTGSVYEPLHHAMKHPAA
jgi:transposase